MNSKHEHRPRIVLPDLKELGRRLKKVDQHIVALLAKRMGLAKQVQERKHLEGNQPIIRLGVEDQRLADIALWAENRGVNPSFAKSILYFIIAESCRVQINHLQSQADESEELRTADGEKSRQILRQNLLSLTATIAPTYDQNYEENADFATASYIRLENKAIMREVGTLRGIDNLGTVLDLGCATGRITLMLAPQFERAVGYDISPQMIEQANKKTHGQNVEFKETDLENGIPADNDSASLVVMNLGTASDVTDLRRIAVATRRVLKKDGRFVFSFYNANALLYHWFVPWPPSLTAEMNLDLHCLNVRIKDKVFRIHARPYSANDAKRILADSGLSVGSVTTYPTIAPLLPSEFFSEDDAEKAREMKKMIEKIDLKLANIDMGAYILVSGRKA